MNEKLLLELISVAIEERLGEALRWWTFKSLKCFIWSLSLRMSSDKARRTSPSYFLCGAFKIVLQKGLTVDFEKVSRSWLLFGKSGAAGKQQRFCFH